MKVRLSLLIMFILFIGCRDENIYYDSTVSEENKRELDQVSKRLKVLEDVVETQKMAVDLLGVNFTDMQGLQDLLEDKLDELSEELNNLESVNDQNMLDVEDKLTVIRSQLSLLEESSRKNIVGIIDPCGDGVGFDEVLLRLRDGTLIAFFESNGKRHLSVIKSGNYITTDLQRCRFAVNGMGEVVL